MPVGVGTVDWNIHATQCIHYAGENGEIYNRQVIYADAQVVQKGGLQQPRATTGVFSHLPILVSSVDAVHTDGGDIDVQIARDGNKRYLSGSRADRRDNDGIRPEIGLAGTNVGAKQRECNRLVVGQNGEGFGSIRRRIERLLCGGSRKDRIRVEGGSRPIR